VEAFEAEPERSPEREVVEPDEPVDGEALIAVVPRRGADKASQQSAAAVLDSKDAGAVHRAAHRDTTVPEPIVHRLEERLREPVDRHVQETARTTSPERVDRPTAEAVREKPMSSRGRNGLIVGQRPKER
jgi:hypothetical protein